VLKTYWPKYTVPVTDTFVCALHLLGHETGELAEAADEASVYATGAVIERKDRADKIRGMLQPVLDSLASVRNENDFLIPWIAKQLVDLWRATGGDDELREHSTGGLVTAVEGVGLGDDEDDEEISDELIAGLAELCRSHLTDYSRALETLKAKGTAIAMWARETKRDLGRVTLAQALEAVADYEFKTRLVPQGTVVYTFPDSYTVQELRSAPELKAEGDTMQHCVGSYCEQVSSGESRIFSLRDAHGNPHVTMEWQRDDSDLDTAPLGRSMPSRGHFVQIYGKQNDPPAEKYKPYVQQFIREKFDADPRSMLLAGAKASELDLSQTDFSGESFVGVDFTGANLRGSVFDQADLSTADLQQADLRGASFAIATLRHADLRGADATGANFYKARLDGSNWDGTVVTDADFSDAGWGDVFDAGRFDVIGKPKDTDDTAFGAFGIKDGSRHTRQSQIDRWNKE
jgi:hypothetical protein